MLFSEKREMAIGLERSGDRNRFVPAQLTQCCSALSQNHSPIKVESGRRWIAGQIRENRIE
jgi:hypothetical protein